MTVILGLLGEKGDHQGECRFCFESFIVMGWQDVLSIDWYGNQCQLCLMY